MPNPDGQVSADPPFDFTRLGLRVPSVLASPWIEKGLVDSTVYEHASVPATFSRLFGLNTFLTARDRAANTFERILTRSTPRDDAPQRLPTVRRRPAPAQPRDLAAEPSEAAPLSEFQQTLVDLADLLAPVPRELEATPGAAAMDEQQAGLRVRAQISQFLE